MFSYMAGDTIRLVIRYPDLPAGSSISGYKYWLTVKTDLAHTDAQAVAQVVTTAGDTDGDIVSTATGTVNVKVIVLQGGIATAGSYFFDVQCKLPSGDIFTVYPMAAKGIAKMTIHSQVTQATA